MIKSGLVFAQTNAESEKRLSINARVVNSERSALGEVTTGVSAHCKGGSQVL